MTLTAVEIITVTIDAEGFCVQLITHMSSVISSSSSFNPLEKDINLSVRLITYLMNTPQWSRSVPLLIIFYKLWGIMVLIRFCGNVKGKMYQMLAKKKKKKAHICLIINAGQKIVNCLLVNWIVRIFKTCEFRHVFSRLTACKIFMP